MRERERERESGSITVLLVAMGEDMKGRGQNITVEPTVGPQSALNNSP